ncbi:hypothetical protein [Mycoplasma sp. ATU-Cv-508]|uniref:hypothetical protein n=1 Tax=Mycoplasma sp. ATU-Cv-508 TaxID=2048001 RepID=UPI000FDE3E9E
MSENSLRADQISRYYVTLGPGSFMGSRASLVLARSIALTTQAELWVASTFSFITNQVDGTYYLKASKTQSYLGQIENGRLNCQLVRLCPSEPFDYYRAFFKHPTKVLDHFKKADNLAKLEPIYLKEPEAAVWKF